MKFGRIGHIYFYILAAVVLSASNPVAAQPVKPSPDEIFNWAERKYNALFPKGSSTQTLQDSGGLIYYRHYTTTDNYLGIQLDNILGMGTFTGGPVTQLGTIAAEGGPISRLVEGLAYAYGTIFAAIRKPATISQRKKEPSVFDLRTASFWIESLLMVEPRAQCHSSSRWALQGILYSHMSLLLDFGCLMEMPANSPGRHLNGVA